VCLICRPRRHLRVTANCGSSISDGKVGCKERGRLWGRCAVGRTWGKRCRPHNPWNRPLDQNPSDGRPAVAQSYPLRRSSARHTDVLEAHTIAEGQCERFGTPSGLEGQQRSDGGHSKVHACNACSRHHLATLVRIFRNSTSCRASVFFVLGSTSISAPVHGSNARICIVSFPDVTVPVARA
jgi:hypothetical protein